MPRGLHALKEAYLLTLSAPIKPGAVHRLAGDPEFELRLVEFVSIEDFLQEAYRRGYMVGRGDIEARNLGLGRYISDALKRSFERTGTRPITGLVSASISLASIIGYYEGSGTSDPLSSAVKKAVRVLLYASPPDDAVFLLEGIEAIGDSDLLLHLDNKSITKRRITLNNLSIGDIFEVLYELDTGFILNLRSLSDLSLIIDIIKKSPNAIAATVEAYLFIAEKRGLFDASKIIKSKNPLAELAKLDKTLTSRKQFNRLLGSVFVGIATSNYEGPLRLSLSS